MKLTEEEVTERALNSLHRANPGTLHDKPTISHPMDQARLASALLIIRERAARPSSNDVITILEALGWPTEEAEEAGRIAALPTQELEQLRDAGKWHWQQSIVDKWFEGDN